MISSPFSLKGVIGAPLTPLDEKLRCDIPAMVSHCKDLIARGCSGIVLFGTTGEGTSFSTSEKREALKALIQSGLQSEKLILTVNCCSIPDALELAREGVDQKCAALLVMPPFYYKHIQESGIVAFYRELISRLHFPSLKIILYHIPQMTGVPFTLEIVKKLQKEFPNEIVGLKESEGNFPLTTDILKQLPDFKLFVGHETQLVEAVKKGGAGCIAGMTNLFPELLISLYQYGKNGSGKNEQDKIEEIRKFFEPYHFISALKSVMQKTKGGTWKIIRPPLIPLGDIEMENLTSQLSPFLK